MKQNDKTPKRCHLEQLIQAKEQQINDEYTRLGTLTMQLTEESIQRVNELTDEIVALKQLCSTLKDRQ